MNRSTVIWALVTIILSVMLSTVFLYFSDRMTHRQAGENQKQLEDNMSQIKINAHQNEQIIDLVKEVKRELEELRSKDKHGPKD
jgi:ABC-type multidrug transport system fused ATPase/permease subunit